MFEHDNKARRSDDLPHFVEYLYGAIVGLILAIVIVYGLSQ
jgi:hypothetical protein